MFTCDICPTSFKKSRLLRLHHRRRHVDRSEWTAKCEECGKVYADDEILTRHKETHSRKEIKLRCLVESCKKSFLRKCYLDKHIAHHHPEILSPNSRENVQKSFEKKCYSCEEPGCVASFGKHHLLTQHSFVHTQIPPFSCSHCDKKFLTLNAKKRHEKVHQGYACKHCDEVSQNWSAHLAHAQSHKEIRKKEFACTTCEKLFSSRSRLNQHTVVHAEVRPVFRCSQCTRTFTKKFALNKHISVFHDGARLFKCHIQNCGKSYAHCHSLKKHIDVFHQPNKSIAKVFSSARPIFHSTYMPTS